MKHPMFRALGELKGNTKACVLTEPLWGIPNSLVAPFASVYMLAFGASDVQIGLIVSLTLFVRTLSAMLSGAITDKLGRRRTTFIFDIICWSLPCLLWAMARDTAWFYAAAVFNGCWQITDNSWTCLLIEDADKRMIVHIYNWVYVSAQLSVFFAPLAGLLVGSLGIISAMRILYGFSFVSMTVKFLILYLYGGETQVGEARMRETKGKSIFLVLSEYRQLIPRFFHSREMLLATVISILFTATSTVMDSFFGVYTTQSLGIADQYLALFPIIRSAIMLLFLFFLQTKLERFGFRHPMMAGVLLYLASHAVLILPQLLWGAQSLLIPVLYTLMQSCAHGLVMPRKDTIVALSLQHEERARMTSILTMLVLFVNIPFGSLAGFLSKTNRSLPFALNIALFAVAFFVIRASRRLGQPQPAQADSVCAGEV